MNPPFLENPAEGYQVLTEVYEGPLDLLLDLIERAELDITQLALAQVTDQYLEYLNHLLERKAEEVSAFVVIAAKLLQIKSAALLPRPITNPIDGEEEDPGEALARQLITYKRFKELGGMLDERAEAGLRSYLRVASPPKVQSKLDLSGVTLKDLLLAARDVFALKNGLVPLSQVVSLPRVTIRERIHHILAKLKEIGTTTFRSLLSPKKNRIEVVVTFLAMLELIKRRFIAAQQPVLFGDIALAPIGNLSEVDTTQLEFED